MASPGCPGGTNLEVRRELTEPGRRPPELTPGRRRRSWRSRLLWWVFAIVVAAFAISVGVALLPARLTPAWLLITKARAGQPEAAYELAVRLTAGIGGSAPDPERGRVFLKQSADKGFEPAMTWLGKECFEEATKLGRELRSFQPRHEEVRHLERIWSLLDQAARYGHSGAAMDISYRYQGASRLKWMRISAAKGNSWALCELGAAHETGKHGLERDEAAAAELYRRSLRSSAGGIAHSPLQKLLARHPNLSVPEDARLLAVKDTGLIDFDPAGNRTRSVRSRRGRPSARTRPRKALRANPSQGGSQPTR